METNALVYKIQKAIVTVDDYILWSHTLLKNGVSSISLNVISSLRSTENIFEVEHYFKDAVKELKIEFPTIEISSRAYIASLAIQILNKENMIELFNLAYEIYRITSDLQYPEDIIEWYNISEMIDQIRYDNSPLKFTEEAVKSKIKHESKRLLDV